MKKVMSMLVAVAIFATMAVPVMATDEYDETTMTEVRPLEAMSLGSMLDVPGVVSELVAYAESLALTVDVYPTQDDDHCWDVVVYGIKNVKYTDWGEDLYIAAEFLVGPETLYDVDADGKKIEISIMEAQVKLEAIADTMPYWQKAVAAITRLERFAHALGRYDFCSNNRTGVFRDGTYWGMIVIRSKNEYREIIVGGRGNGPLKWKIYVAGKGVHNYSRDEAELWFKSNPQEPLA